MVALGSFSPDPAQHSTLRCRTALTVMYGTGSGVKKPTVYSQHDATSGQFWRGYCFLLASYTCIQWQDNGKKLRVNIHETWEITTVRHQRRFG